MSRILSVMLLSCAVLACGARGETVRFTNGTTVRGRIERAGEYVSIRTSDGQVLRVKRSLIAAVAPEASAETPAEPLPAPAEEAEQAASELSRTLDRTMTVDFQQTPLTEVVQFLRAETGLNFAMDPDIKADEITITLSLKDMKLISILRWIAYAGKVAIVIRGDGPVVRIADRGRSPERLALYDVRPEMVMLMDRPSPPLTMAEGAASSSVRGQAAGFGRSAKGRDIQDLDLQRRGHDLIELLARTTGPDKWDHAFVSGRLPAGDYLAGD